MSNQIRPVSPVFHSLETVVFEVAVPADVSSFTWAILREPDNGEDDTFPTIVAVGWRPHDLSSTRRVRTEHTIRAGSADWVPATEERASAVTTSEYGDDDGDYLLQFFAGRPDDSASDTVIDFIQGSEPIDEDSFSVLASFETPEGATSTGVDFPDIGETLKVALVRPPAPEFTEAQSPVTYTAFREWLDARNDRGDRYDAEDSWPAYGSGPYLALRDAARDFVATRRITDFNQLIPKDYLTDKLKETQRQFPSIPLPPAQGRGAARTSYLPAVELIWNYWLEEGMLVQTLNVILARFQNRRLPGRDPLGRFDVTPLLPLRNKLWGFAEDELHRMTIRRRAVEYEYEYGFALIGRAIPPRQQLVERRSGFLATFHQVLHLAHQYFKEYDDLTVQADAFPLYRALRDCHIVLSQGTQNQYGEMAVAARAEFLVMQSILAEPQMREFLGGRPMTPYPEAWMDRVDAMKAIQGWSDTSIMNFNDLATIGEQLVLTIRLGNWADTGVGGTQAANWAAAFRSGIQQYTAAYRTATGVDLAREANAEMPSTLLARKLAGNRIRA